MDTSSTIVETNVVPSKGGLREWFMHDVRPADAPGAAAQEHHAHRWWQVMCLTGVDYFSTLGYQPGIAFLAAGVLSPIATLVLVILTLFGALPIYRHVATESPHGQGSISMLEALLTRWKGKLFVLALLGFAATDFVITITLSAADATEHVIHNPYIEEHFPWMEHPVALTLLLVTVLAAVFLKGFKEAIGLAVALVSVFLILNLVVVVTGIYQVFQQPQLFSEWENALFISTTSGMPETRSLLMILALSLLVFPKLALGLSGFETGVAVMPLIENPNRVEKTRRMLMAAALIMSFFLILSSFITTVLIPAAEFAEGGKAQGRALAFVAHRYLGEIFGTVYDVSTILILWFAGASAMAGLLNIVPRYLPRYGMAPNWARATRPLVIVFAAICFAITIIFDANVEAQGGAYATGVLVLMTSAGIAVTISTWYRGKAVRWAYLVISVVFAYTTITNIIERPDGIKIAAFFIAGTVIASFISRAMRTTEIRIDKIEFDAPAERFLDDLASEGEVRIVTNRRESGDVAEYRYKEHEKRMDNHIPSTDPILFYEVEIGDASEFSGKLAVSGKEVGGHRILSTRSPAVPNAIAALLLELRDRTGKIPHVYFGWSEGNPIKYLVRYLLFGEGDTAPVTREILRQAEPDPELRPNVHVGG
ncbi:MAG: amino acid transporter [Acidobacteria bacterium]|nr:amino acid transporter [Acidobacteriota bacterium]